MSKKTPASNCDLAYREAFLARLNEKLAVPTPEWPTVRCWTKPALDHVFRQLRDELAVEGLHSSQSHSSLLKWLCRLRLAAPLPVESKPIFLIEIGAAADADVDPLELLVAGKPSGVVCFFSAVAFHALTTQLVEHHHVAELHAQRHEHEEEDVTEKKERLPASESHKPRRLGQILFRFRGVPYYITRRSTRLVPGIQTRGYGPRTQIRITTMEQTLLDTLYKPFHCGGPEVVFEAWKNAVGSHRIDEERLVAYLQAMNYPATTRRLGVMLELTGAAPGAELGRFLKTSQEEIDRQSPFARISLLPSVDYQKVNEPWLVNTP